MEKLNTIISELEARLLAMKKDLDGSIETVVETAIEYGKIKGVLEFLQDYEERDLPAPEPEKPLKHAKEEPLDPWFSGMAKKVKPSECTSFGELLDSFIIGM